MSEVDQPPTVPGLDDGVLGAPKPEGAPSPPLEEQTIRIAVGDEMVSTPAVKVAPGVFVHINPAKAEGLEEAEGDRLWSVTHGPSGQAIDNESETKTLAIRLAEKLAAVGDWMRSSAEIAADTDFARTVQRLLKDERGFIRIPFFNKKQKQAIPKEEIKSPDPMVEDALTARSRTGKSLWEGMKGFPGEVHRTWGAEFFYEFKVLKWPRFVEGLRRFADAPLDLALEATNEVKSIVKPLDHSQFQIFEKIVVGKDIRENLRREIPQGALTFEQMDKEIGRLEGVADVLIMDRVQAHDALMEEVGDDLIKREKMKPEHRKAHYFTNRVIAQQVHGLKRKTREIESDPFPEGHIGDKGPGPNRAIGTLELGEPIRDLYRQEVGLVLLSPDQNVPLRFVKLLPFFNRQPFGDGFQDQFFVVSFARIEDIPFFVLPALVLLPIGQGVNPFRNRLAVAAEQLRPFIRTEEDHGI